MRSIPLIRASQIQPFAVALHAGERSTERVLDTLGLRPTVLEESPDDLVPEYLVWSFADRCARIAGADTFGFDVGIATPIEGIGSFGREIGGAATLRGALRLFLEAVTKHSSHARFSVVPANDRVWFCRHGINDIDVGSWQIEQYVLGMMVRVARVALGPTWCPAEILLKQPRVKGVVLPPEIVDARVRWSCAATAISIPAAALDVPLRGTGTRGSGLRPIDLDFLGSLKLALLSMLGTGVEDLESAARLSGVTPRTVQRWLKREGRSFALLLEDLRRESALQLIHETNLPLREVANRLGYTDPANFTRAFRRWTGITPSRSRRLAGASDPKV